MTPQKGVIKRRNRRTRGGSFAFKAPCGHAPPHRVSNRLRQNYARVSLPATLTELAAALEGVYTNGVKPKLPA
ncbi:hypothetical protein [Arthrobacter sp. zg-Y1143]|uniref:hypothetical protein n=1 Tax=Arthrobacter sp. zg-Y1143 TaxID=3049065 RepID=UPI0024C2307E|nr:hypothetical protein [Arthrobacter sp. zg-Y1143]MDK1328075.1 hypothetical protein [Arthrobacter sp. zg-Y1143]